MEWFGLALVGAVVFFWWLGRDPSAFPPRPDAAGGQPPHAAPPVAGTAVARAGLGLMGTEVLRRATDMNDPDGTFMDGYVAGRLTERAEARDEMDTLAARQTNDELDTSYGWSGSDGETWEESGVDGYDDVDGDMSDDW